MNFAPGLKNPFRRESYAFPPVSKDYIDELTKQHSNNQSKCSTFDQEEEENDEILPLDATLINTGFTSPLRKGSATPTIKLTAPFSSEQKMPQQQGSGLNANLKSNLPLNDDNNGSRFRTALRKNSIIQRIEKLRSGSVPNLNGKAPGTEVMGGPKAEVEKVQRPRISRVKPKDRTKVPVARRFSTNFELGKRRESFQHPGLPTIGPATQSLLAASGSSRRASIQIQGGSITVTGQGGGILGSKRRDSIRVAPSFKVDEDVCKSLDSFASTMPFPEGYLLGFSDCKEVLESKELKVIGEIPLWLKGVFFRCVVPCYTSNQGFLTRSSQ
jgi:hypothetical protein